MTFEETVRTTVDLPTEVHRQVTAITLDTSRTFSETVADLIRHGLRSEVSSPKVTTGVTGLPLIHVGRPITATDVRTLDEEV